MASKMKVLPDVGPRPRLLSSAVMSPPATAEKAAEKVKQSATGRRFTRTLCKVAVAGLIGAVVVHWLVHRGNIQEEAIAIRKLVVVGTRMLARAGHQPNPPNAIVVQLNADLLQVTSIALGHPRLAVINGKQVAEGEQVIVHTPTRSISVALRVLEISDRQVTLSDGTQVITVHLSKTGENSDRADRE